LTLTNDITLAGVAYTVVPGAYRKRGAPATPATLPRDVHRLVLRDFAAGLTQAIARHPTPDTRHPSLGWAPEIAQVGPCFDGQGVEPFPHQTGFADTELSEAPSLTLRAYHAFNDTRAYAGIGRRLWQTPQITATAWGDLFPSVDLGAGFTIRGLAPYQNDILLLLGNGTDIRKFDTTSHAVTTWRVGERATHGVPYKGQKR
jgi:hypothetical protein